jgi:hypothetical protein
VGGNCINLAIRRQLRLLVGSRRLGPNSRNLPKQYAIARCLNRLIYQLDV